MVRAHDHRVHLSYHKPTSPEAADLRMLQWPIKDSDWMAVQRQNSPGWGVPSDALSQHLTHGAICQ